MVKDALDAFVQAATPQLARDVLRRDDEVDELKDQMFRELLTYMMADPGTIQRALALILISRNLERIARPRHQHRRGRDLHRRGEGRATPRRARHGEAMKTESAERVPGEEQRRAPRAKGRADAPADTRRRVLLIEDDADIAEAIGYQMEKAGLSVRVARTGEEGLEAVRKGVDLVLLDLNLPGMDGLEVCRMIRRQQTTAHLPIIIVSARADEVDRVLGLEMGADDYVVKPFSLKELAARAKVALRRNSGAGEPPLGYRDENWEIEFDAYVVRYKGQEIRLTHKEFELFRYLVERPGRVLTRERLLERVWGWEKDIDVRSIDAHIRRLRIKLGEARNHVETVVGLGYRFVK